jgi:hypothetical protein
MVTPLKLRHALAKTEVFKSFMLKLIEKVRAIAVI